MKMSHYAVRLTYLSATEIAVGTLFGFPRVVLRILGADDVSLGATCGGKGGMCWDGIGVSEWGVVCVTLVLRVRV